MRIHINIGSNRGDRLALIERAVAAVCEAIPGACSRSQVVETEPWGFDSPFPFLNIGLMIETDAEAAPVGILRRLQAVEHSIDPSPHRDSSGAYADRRIDIDLIAVDSIVADTPELTLPHPRMHQRFFVLEPMRQIDPGWVHPIMGVTLGAMLEQIGYQNWK